MLYGVSPDLLGLYSNLEFFWSLNRTSQSPAYLERTDIWRAVSPFCRRNICWNIRFLDEVKRLALKLEEIGCRSTRSTKAQFVLGEVDIQEVASRCLRASIESCEASQHRILVLWVRTLNHCTLARFWHCGEHACKNTHPDRKGFTELNVAKITKQKTKECRLRHTCCTTLDTAHHVFHTQKFDGLKDQTAWNTNGKWIENAAASTWKTGSARKEKRQNKLTMAERMMERKNEMREN